MIDCTTEVTGLTRVIKLGFIDLQKVFAMGRVKQFGVDEEALVVASLLGLLGDTARNLSLEQVLLVCFVRQILSMGLILRIAYNCNS